MTIVNSVAGITNVAICHKAIQRAFDREGHLPGMAVFYGPSGFGKSVAACYAANHFDAVYVQCKSTWTRKALLEATLKEMGIKPGKTLPYMSDQISEELTLSNRPLIIDEFDYLVDKKQVDVIRDIYESSQGTILLIGEEQLPRKLQRWERFHGRILEFFPAQPVSISDIAQLQNIYTPGIDIEDALIKRIHKAAKGSARRVCVNLDRVRDFAVTDGKQAISNSDWGDKSFFTGDVPNRRLQQ